MLEKLAKGLVIKLEAGEKLQINVRELWKSSSWRKTIVINLTSGMTKAHNTELGLDLHRDAL